MRGVVAGTPARARRILRTVLVMVCTMGLLAAASGPALAKKHKPRPRKWIPIAQTPITTGSRYLALGDSVTFGYEEPSVVPAPSYQDATSFLGYPEMLGAELHLRVVNAACPGETSSSLINASAQSNGCENAPGSGNVGYRTLHRLHVSYGGSQLDFAVSYLRTHHDVRLVSLMIGANDAFVCRETTSDQCQSPSELAAVAATIEKNVKTILSAIRDRAHYRGQLAIVNYYSLDYSNALDNSLSGLFNQSMDTAARPFGVEVADGFGELEAGSVHSADSTCKAGLLTQLSTGQCGIHPSYAGQALLAQALEKVIRLI